MDEELAEDFDESEPPQLTINVASSVKKRAQAPKKGLKNIASTILFQINYQ